MPNLVRAPSFRVALDHKLFTIIRAFGSAAEAARQCKAPIRSFNWWRSGHFPSAPFLAGIDEAYAMAVELLNDPELLRKREKVSKEIVSLSRKLKLSESAVKALKAEGLY